MTLRSLNASLAVIEECTLGPYPCVPTALTHVLVLAVNHIDTAPLAIRKYLFLTPISIYEFAMQSPGRPFSGPRR